MRVYDEFLDPGYLASCHAGSPDPRKCGFYGRQLIVKWSFRKDLMNCPDLHLLLRVRNRSAEIQEVRIPVCRRKGVYVYRDRGIATYQVQVRLGERVLETYSDQVWAEVIEV